MIDQTTIREALRKLLADDSELEGLLAQPGAIYHRKAPLGAVPPYIIFFKQAGQSVLTMKPGDYYVNQLWMIKGISRGGDAVEAEAIDARCEKIVANGGLEIAGAELAALWREGDVEYGEPDAADTVHHVGGTYRLEVQ